MVYDNLCIIVIWLMMNKFFLLGIDFIFFGIFFWDISIFGVIVFWLGWIGFVVGFVIIG